MILDHDNAAAQHFAIQGEVMALSELRKGNAPAGQKSFTRPMGGWLAVYGNIGPDGGIVPSVDRQGEIFEAARQLGLIDWSPYLKGGKWNDTHNKYNVPAGVSEVIVGLPNSLEFHDGTTPLSKAHGKVGFWTTGRLFDRVDPMSWDGLGRRPTEHEFARADHFWNLAHMLKGLPRPIGFSAHGVSAVSKCGKRIVYAQVAEAAVCELPVSPNCTAEILEKGRAMPDLIDVLMKGTRFPTAGGVPCGKCSCPVGACEGLLLQKGVAGVTIAPQDLESAPSMGKMSGPTVPAHDPNPSTKERVILRLMERFLVSREQAEQWLALWFVNAKQDAANAAVE